MKFSILSTSALMFTFRFECHEKGPRFPESIFFYYYFSFTRTSFILGAPFISWPVIYRACRRKTASPKGFFFFFVRETWCDPALHPLQAHFALGQRVPSHCTGQQEVGGWQIWLGETGMTSGSDCCLSLTAWTLFFMGSMHFLKETFG